MSVLRINARGDGILAAGSQGVHTALATALRDRDPHAPTVILIHGFTHSPFRPDRCPHRTLFGLDRDPFAPDRVSWPEGLEFDPASPSDGLCIAFGWHATGTIWTACRAADAAGRALSDLLREIRRHRAGPVHLLAHSLGARVALGAMATLPPRSLGRVVLLAGAVLQSQALHAVGSPAGRTAEVVNVTSRENDVFDAVFEALVAPCRPLGTSIGSGLGQPRSNWLDIQIDDPQTRGVLQGMGIRIPAPTGAICHRSAYLRPGLFDLHRRLLLDPEGLALDALRRALPCDRAPRWARVLRRIDDALQPGPDGGRQAA